jgi:hypothetical protein
MLPAKRVASDASHNAGAQGFGQCRIEDWIDPGNSRGYLDLTCPTFFFKGFLFAFSHGHSVG